MSAASAASDNNAVVNKSLEGLVSAMDELKKSLGLGNSYDFAEVEAFVEKARQENEEFRQFAEDAIKVGAGLISAPLLVAVLRSSSTGLPLSTRIPQPFSLLESL